MPEWRKFFEAQDSDFGGLGPGGMEVCSSNERGAEGASHLGMGDHRSKTRPKQTTISPGKRVQVRRFTLTGYERRPAEFRAAKPVTTALSPPDRKHRVT